MKPGSSTPRNPLKDFLERVNALYETVVEYEKNSLHHLRAYLTELFSG